jgi:hypothetical protein
MRSRSQSAVYVRKSFNARYAVDTVQGWASNATQMVNDDCTLALLAP